MPARDRRTNDWHETKYRAVKFECRHWMDTLIISDQKLIFFPSFSIRVGKFRVEKKDLKGDRLVRDRSHQPYSLVRIVSNRKFLGATRYNILFQEVRVTVFRKKAANAPR